MAKVAYTQLIDLAEGRLSAQAADTLRQQIVADPALSAELAAVEELIGLMRSDTGVDAPEHVITRALRLMRRPEPAPGPGLLQRIVAVLRSASASQAPALDLRSTDTASRSLAYSATPWDLDLQITPRAGRWHVQGQLLGPTLTGVVELRSVTEAARTETNELGEFILPPVAPGSYTLAVQLTGHQIVVESLEIGP